jgi:small-conductance mechanosensitive channel
MERMWTGWVVLAAGLLSGMLVDGLLLPRLQRLAERTNRRVLRLTLHVIRWQVTIIAVVVGTLAVVQASSLPAATIAAAFKLGAIILILAAAIAVIRFLTGAVHRALSHQGRSAVSLVNLLINVVGALIVLVLALGLLDVDVAPLLTLIAGSSLGLSLALRDPLANLFAGVQLLAANRLRPGSYVRLSNGEEGYVVDIRWSDTTLRQLANNFIIVPNAILTTTIVVDYDQPDAEQLLLIDVAIAQRVEQQLIEHVTLEVANEVMREVPGGVPGWQPRLRYARFSETQLCFVVVLRISSYAEQFRVRHEFLKRLQERYLREGITLPTPPAPSPTPAPPAATDQLEQSGERGPPKTLL